MQGNPCNSHARDLGDIVKTGVEQANMVGFQTAVPGVRSVRRLVVLIPNFFRLTETFHRTPRSDNIGMGHDGMLYSLPSRDIIADALEMNIEAHRYDGAILIPSCDKNMPACMIAAARYNRPTILVYGGAILAGRRTIDCPALGAKAGDPLNIGNLHESYGGVLSGEITAEQHEDVIKHACPGAGSCGGMFTANTMSSIMEVGSFRVSTPAHFTRDD